MNDFALSIHDSSFEFFNMEYFMQLMEEQLTCVTENELFAWVTQLTMVSSTFTKEYSQFEIVQITVNEWFPMDLTAIAHSLTFTLRTSDGKVTFTLYFTEEYTYSGYDLHESPDGMQLGGFTCEFKLDTWCEVHQPVKHKFVIE